MDPNESALALLDRLLKSGLPPDLQERLVQVQDRILLPMAVVLAKIPGETITEKAKAIGVSRQAYYAWLYGRARPNPKQAVVIGKLTGLPPEQIRGRKLTTPPPAPARRRRPRATRRVKRNRNNLSA